MSRKLASLMVAAGIACSVAACAPFTESPLDKDAADLKTALAGEPVDVTKQSGSITLTSSADYLYPSGGWQIRPGAPLLTKMLPVFTRLQNTKIVVGGYTDNTPVGPQLKAMGIVDNVDLSDRRASAVVTFFQQNGVNPNLLSAHGFGDSNPVASNDTPEGRAKNRRVEITLSGNGT